MPESVLSTLRSQVPTKDDQQILSFQFKGYLIMVGQNCYSNERLVAHHPHRDCIWMHAMAARGSHVVLCLSSNSSDPAEEILQYAAKIALKHSHSEARTVSVALLKDVQKKDGFGVGVFKPIKSMTLEVQ